MGKIDVSDLSLDYTDRDTVYHVLDGVSFSVKEGEFVSIIGSSGCGKSTLLNVLAGLNKQKSGSFRIDGQETEGTGKNRGVVFQHYSLFPWMTVRKNVIFGIRQNFPGKPKNELEAEAQYYLEAVGLKGFENKYPYQLSGGMQQRAAIARTLAMKTDILLMDEPFGAIDAKNRVILQYLLLDILQKSSEKRTIVFVTHDVDEAILLSDRILFMKNKRIYRDILIDFKRPRSREEMMDSPHYKMIRRNIVDLFYYDSDTINDEVKGGEGI